jgi:peptidoglycan/LPS O-acetylase OafA/YrhL
VSAETLTPMPGMPRFPTLDGCRALSILLVLAGHLFPLGPKAYQINESVAALGMAIFFVLSGFLITTTLLHRPSVGEFLTRRLCRILPLAWLFTVIALSIAGAPLQFYIAQLFFFANVPPFWLTDYTAHLWSLCVEMQFYVLIALLFAAFGRRGLWSIPLLCLAVTAHRVQEHALLWILTTDRVDEILAGGTLALICYYPRFSGIRRLLTLASPLMLLPFAIASCNTLLGAFDYLRPYLAAALVGSTLNGLRPAIARFLQLKSLAYIAAISYALYVWHPIVEWGWLGTGSKVIKYAKRIPALVAVFGVAHLSTFYYEDFWIRKGKAWSKRFKVAVPQH